MSYLARFYEILIFESKLPFCKAYSLCTVANCCDFQRLVIFRTLGFFLKPFFAQSNSNEVLDVVLRMVFGILIS